MPRSCVEVQCLNGQRVMRAVVGSSHNRPLHGRFSPQTLIQNSNSKLLAAGHELLGVLDRQRRKILCPPRCGACGGCQLSESRRWYLLAALHNEKGI